MSTINVCITGAAGQIGYSLIYMVCHGDVFGSEQRINLFLLDIKPMMDVLNGVVMEITDCAFSLVNSVVATADPNEAFNDCDAAFLVGAMPRREGMERKDLLKANKNIFVAQGKALDTVAKKSVKVLVVGNPANTNALICLKNAPSIDPSNFSAMTRLDQNRATANIAGRLGVANSDVSNVVIWGNHSSTQFPDVSHAVVAGKSVYQEVNNDDYLQNEFVKTIQTRGAAVIKARKLSSAMSAAKAACDHMRDWWGTTPAGKFVSMAVLSNGKHYGIPEGIVYSFPVRMVSGSWSIVEGLPISEFARGKMDISANELQEEATQAFSD